MPPRMDLPGSVEHFEAQGRQALSVAQALGLSRDEAIKFAKVPQRKPRRHSELDQAKLRRAQLARG